ncbi:hypothetical protein K458DRAFT_407346 [Lentithecium fluviatile CBS 122367]|uniref:Uncharacterized protein n=1 Tax=Lentithecium fluviatile CBS 122367 TaxID=1168545 RepID=A0A6G1IQV1_9PLEO|nr:hypothetical protein K458DRAFT_407346 [Lentithecium fluviatile CBS 122367]
MDSSDQLCISALHFADWCWFDHSLAGGLWRNFCLLFFLFVGLAGLWAGGLKKSACVVCARRVGCGVLKGACWPRCRANHDGYRLETEFLGPTPHSPGAAVLTSCASRSHSNSLSSTPSAHTIIRNRLADLDSELSAFKLYSSLPISVPTLLDGPRWCRVSMQFKLVVMPVSTCWFSLTALLE